MKKNNLPEGWITTSLENIITKISNGTSKRQIKEKTDFPVSRIETISNQTIDFNKVRFLENPSDHIIESFTIQKGDILFSNINSDIHLGKTAIYNDDRLLLHGLNLLLIRSNPKIINYKFLNFQLNYLRRVGKFISIAQHAVNQSSINQTKLKSLILLLSPLEEQKRIVDKIEELFSKLDKSKIYLAEIKLQLKQLKHSLLRSAFNGELTSKLRDKNKMKLDSILLKIEEGKKTQNKKLQNIEPCKNYDLFKIPKSWAWIQVGTISKDIHYGTSEKAMITKTKIPVLRMGNIQDGELDFNNLKYYPENWKHLNQFLLKDGDILFNRTNSAELVGKTAVYKDIHPSAVFAGYLIRVKVFPETYIPFLISWYINSIFGKSYIKTVVSQQVGQANVNATKLSVMPIPIMPYEEQKEIVEKLELYFSLIKNTEETVNNMLKKIESHKLSILKQAFEGKLVPQNPQDEDITIILQKINQEKI